MIFCGGGLGGWGGGIRVLELEGKWGLGGEGVLLSVVGRSGVYCL